MKKIFLMVVVILAACLSFNDEAKAATKVDLTNEYNWTSVHRPDVLRLRVIDSNNNIKRELTWIDTWAFEDTDPRVLGFKITTTLFCDGDVLELTNVDKNTSIHENLSFHELQMSMIDY